MPFGRRPPQKSTAGRTLERLGGLLPGSAATGGGGKGKAGLAALAAVGALAFKHRDKAAALLDRARSRDDVEPPGVSAVPGPPTSPTGGLDPAPEEATGTPDQPAA